MKARDWKSRLVRLATLRSKLIIPYALLSLLLALVGIFVVSRLVSATWHERVSNQLFETSEVAKDGIVRQERENLENLRLMVFSLGVAEAMTAQGCARRWKLYYSPSWLITR